jgi:hypothetical protein
VSSAELRADAGQRLLRELVDWRPPGGVVSVCLTIDPADRSEGWRIELRHALEGVDERTAARVLERFSEEVALPHGRTHVGFLERGTGRNGGREIWHDFQINGREAVAVEGERPYLAPLVSILDDGWPVGVVVLALESVRVLEWALGETLELDGWELEITSLDWRERKATRVDTAKGTATSASGRDQYRQRLDHNREQFLKHAGQLVASRYGERPWRQLVVIGEGDGPSLLRRGLGGLGDRVHEVAQDLIRASASEIGARLDEELEHLNRRREERLLAEIEEAIGSPAGAALGPDEVLGTLAEGRARHAIFDAGREWEVRDGLPVSELIIERSLATSAQVTPAEGLAAAALRKHDGAAALLRY